MAALRAEDGPLQLRIALLGNPCTLLEWNDDSVGALVKAGFNEVQLNLAWLRRPFDEALNLRDVVTAPGDMEEPRTAERRAELLKRNEVAKRYGLRTMFHFGSPFMWRNPVTGEIERQTTECGGNNPWSSEDPWCDVMNPAIVEHETALLREFRKQFPDVDDILVYTYDQDAWQASEFAQGKRSRGIPLHKRLPGFLRALHQVWTEGREDKAMMWWEPWELSAGQIYKILPQLPTTGFGMMLHSNIAEVQITNPVDVWFKNTARICKELGIPVVGEGFFCSATEEIEPLSIPCPRLVDEEFKAITSTQGIVGIKEYFGVLPLTPDPNLDILTMRLSDAHASTEELLERIIIKYGEQSKKVKQVWDMLSDAIQMFPWDSSWFARCTGNADIDHGWSAATIRGLMVETPSWRSTRYAQFMMTLDFQPHPFMLEDVGYRCELAAETLAKALPLCRELSKILQDSDQQDMFRKLSEDVETLMRVSRSYALHLRETNVAHLLREDLEAERPMTPHLLDEMAKLLEADAENQDHKGRVVEMKNLFEKDPKTFIRTKLLPTEVTICEKGPHTLTTR